MPEVAFHFNAPDRLAYACRLLRKAYMRQARVFVWVDQDHLVTLDGALWTMGAGDFVPHCRADDPEPVRRCSPIHLGTSLPTERSGWILVNLRHDMPDDPMAFERVIEVVTLDEADRAAARDRWRGYKTLGMEPLRHDLNVAAPD